MEIKLVMDFSFEFKSNTSKTHKIGLNFLYNNVLTKWFWHSGKGAPAGAPLWVRFLLATHGRLKWQENPNFYGLRSD